MAIKEYDTISPNGYNLTYGGEGGVLSDETIRKLSGTNNHFYGKKHSNETRKKLSDALSGHNHPMYGKYGPLHNSYGKKASPETVAKIIASLTNRHPTEETRIKLSKAKTGARHPMFGRHHTEEAKQKISEKISGEKNPNFGKIFSVEHRRKIAESKKGKHPSSETRQKMSIAHSGKNNHWFGICGDKNPLFGRKISEETKQKNSKSHFGIKLTEEAKEKISRANKGKVRTPEVKEKLRQKCLERTLNKIRNGTACERTCKKYGHLVKEII